MSVNQDQSTQHSNGAPTVASLIHKLLTQRPTNTPEASRTEHVRLVADALAAHRTTLFVVATRSGRLELVAALGEAAPKDTEAHRFEEALVHRAYESGTLAQAAGHGAPPMAVASGGEGDVVRAIAVPVTDARRVIHGVLHVARPPYAPAFSPTDAEVLSACAAALVTHCEFQDVTDLYQGELADRERELDEARAAIAAKSDFMSSVSHELRTPLNAAHGFTQLLEVDVAGSSHAATLKNLRAGADHLRQLIDDITDIHRIERGVVSMEIAPTPLRQLMETFLSILAIEADRSGPQRTAADAA